MALESWLGFYGFRTFAGCPWFIRRAGCNEVFLSGVLPMPRAVLVGTVASILLLATAGRAAEEAVQVFERIQDSVVELRNVMGGGTGIILNQDGLVLTNAHVVASPLRMECVASVEINSHRKDVVFDEVEILGVHPKKDLAVVKFNPGQHGSTLKPVQISWKKSLPGQRIYAIGNPASGSQEVQLTKTITEGLLSGVDRVIEEVSYYQISAPVNPGNSGGPLVDSSGVVLGLVTLKFTDVENVGFAIPLFDLDLSDFVPLEARAVDKERSAALMAFANQMVARLAELEKRGQDGQPIAELLKALATQGFLEALLNDSTNPRIYAALAVMMTTYDEQEAAEALCKQTLEMMPWGDSPQHYRLYGHLLVKTDRKQDGEIVWQEGIAKFPMQGAQIWEDLAILYRDREDYLESGRCAATALYLVINRRAKIRGDLVKQIYHLCLSKLPPHLQQELKARAAAVPEELKKLDLRAEQNRRRNTPAMRHDFKRFLSQEDIRLSKRKPRRTTGALSNKLLPSSVALTPQPSDPVAAVDLLDGLDTSRNTIKGLWLTDAGKLISLASPNARIQIPAELPQEYDLTMDVTRLEGDGELAVGFVREGTQSVFLIDAGGSRSGISGHSAGVHSGPVLPKDKTVHLLLYVRRVGLAVEADKQRIFFEKTSDDFPATPATWRVRDAFQLFLGSNESSFRIDFVQMRNAQ